MPTTVPYYKVVTRINDRLYSYLYLGLPASFRRRYDGGRVVPS